MRPDTPIPADSAILALCLACAAMAYLHSGPKVAGTVLIASVVSFTLLDRAFTLFLMAGFGLALGALVLFERRRSRAN